MRIRMPCGRGSGGALTRPSISTRAGNDKRATWDAGKEGLYTAAAARPPTQSAAQTPTIDFVFMPPVEGPESGGGQRFNWWQVGRALCTHRDRNTRAARTRGARAGGSACGAAGERWGRSRRFRRPRVRRRRS